MHDAASLIHWIEKLTGRRHSPLDHLAGIHETFPAGGMGYSQFNEYMLGVQANRVSERFFVFVFGGTTVEHFDHFRSAIIAYRKLAMLQYGSFVHTFNVLANKNLDAIRAAFSEFEDRSADTFQGRHPPLIELKTIAPEDTHVLGYISGQAPDIEDSRRQRVEAAGRHNHDVYLDFDHMDVYIATSMRERLDFWNVAQFAAEIQNDSNIRSMKLRFFDPTQAFCKDRLDKGLVEGLMLKRACCTIYMVGESETLGKDSELAATLAQGKPVIAYVPNFPDYRRFRDDYVEQVLAKVYPTDDKVSVGLKFLKIFWPEGAWEDDEVRGWLRSKEDVDVERLIRLIFDKAKIMYDKKERILKELHPLGLQVNLRTGVANGVLVARSVGQCARLLKGVILNRLNFDIEEKGGAELLIETETKSIYRVVTKDQHVTNSFWNFYS